VATQGNPAGSARSRATLISASAIGIILLGAGAWLLPAVAGIRGAVVLGGLLIAAGLLETLAGTMRRETKPFAVIAGCVTLLAGLIFLVKPSDGFFPNVLLVVAWLLVRSLVLAIASRRVEGSVQTWTSLSAGIDFVLAVLLATGLSIATIVVSLFGPTPPLIASFAWVLAASFVANGLMLLEVASCERNAN
jgi:uncharacterized membrane protein HdeD (DUF308 family)